MTSSSGQEIFQSSAICITVAVIVELLRVQTLVQIDRGSSSLFGTYSKLYFSFIFCETKCQTHGGDTGQAKGIMLL